MKPFTVFRSLRLPVVLIILVSTALGALWGLKIKRDRMAELAKQPAHATIRVLAYKGLFTPDYLKSFEQNQRIHVDLTEVSTYEEMASRVADSDENHSYDLITMFASQLIQASQDGKIQAIDGHRMENFKLVASDFVDTTFISGSTGVQIPAVLPILWGLETPDVKPSPSDTTEFSSILTAHVKTLKSEKPMFWMLCFAVGRNAEDFRALYVFLDSVLSPSFAIWLTHATGQASTNTSLESSSLEARMKPSHLRDIHLTDYVIERNVTTPKK